MLEIYTQTSWVKEADCVMWNEKFHKNQLVDCHSIRFHSLIWHMVSTQVPQFNHSPVALHKVSMLMLPHCIQIFFMFFVWFHSFLHFVYILNMLEDIVVRLLTSRDHLPFVQFPCSAVHCCFIENSIFLNFCFPSDCSCSPRFPCLWH